MSYVQKIYSNSVLNTAFLYESYIQNMNRYIHEEIYFTCYRYIFQFRVWHTTQIVGAVNMVRLVDR